MSKKSIWVALVLTGVFFASSCARDESAGVSPVESTSQWQDRVVGPGGFEGEEFEEIEPIQVPVLNEPGRVPDKQPGEDDPLAVKISADSLRDILLSQNTQVLTALNRLHIAKEHVNVARGNLLPSINLGTLLLAAASPTFAVASFNFLFPFLMPSNWFDYFKQKDLLKSEKMSFLLVELNQYASALSLVLTMRTDLDIQGFLAEEVEDFDRLEKMVAISYGMGIASVEEVLTVESQVNFAKRRLREMNKLIIAEQAALRKALALSLDSPIIIPRFQMPSSDWEGAPIATAIENALTRAPESMQLIHLESAAKKEKWSKIFSFITGFSMGTRPGETGMSFSGLNSGGQFNLGFATVPMVKIAQKNLEELKIRGKELRLEVTRVLETALNQLGDVRESYELARQAEENMRRVYRSALLNYELGLDGLRPVLDARFDVREAATQRLKTEMELNLLRVTLHRTMLTDQFSKIPGCAKVKESMTKEEEKEFKELRDRKSLEQICRG